MKLYVIEELVKDKILSMGVGEYEIKVFVFGKRKPVSEYKELVVLGRQRARGAAAPLQPPALGVVGVVGDVVGDVVVVVVGGHVLLLLVVLIVLRLSDSIK